MQQINLYLPELRPRKKWLTANTVAGCAFGFLCLLLVGAYFQHHALNEKAGHVGLIESQVSSSTDRIKRITQKTQPLIGNKLDREINRFKQLIRAREQIGQIIQGQNLGNEAGFSETLISLSRESLPTISLERIRISRGGKFIEAKGLTNSAQDVPRYIQNLQEQSHFSTTQFGLLSLSESPESSRLYYFTMGFDSVSRLVSLGDPKQ